MDENSLCVGGNPEKKSAEHPENSGVFFCAKNLFLFSFLTFAAMNFVNFAAPNLVAAETQKFELKNFESQIESAAKKKGYKMNKTENNGKPEYEFYFNGKYAGLIYASNSGTEIHVIGHHSAGDEKLKNNFIDINNPQILQEILSSFQ